MKRNTGVAKNKDTSFASSDKQDQLWAIQKTYQVFM